jgi:hypothetical protein
VSRLEGAAAGGQLRQAAGRVDLAITVEGVPIEIVNYFQSPEPGESRAEVGQVSTLWVMSIFAGSPDSMRMVATALSSLSAYAGALLP